MGRSVDTQKAFLEEPGSEIAVVHSHRCQDASCVHYVVGMFTGSIHDVSRRLRPIISGAPIVQPLRIKPLLQNARNSVHFGSRSGWVLAGRRSSSHAGHVRTDAVKSAILASFVVDLILSCCPTSVCLYPVMSATRLLPEACFQTFTNLCHELFIPTIMRCPYKSNTICATRHHSAL